MGSRRGPHQDPHELGGRRSRISLRWVLARKTGLPPPSANWAVTIGTRSRRIGAYLKADGELLRAGDWHRRGLDADRAFGRELAIIVHRASLDQAMVRAELTPTMLLALDNERLRAASASPLFDCCASRARIAAVEDDERRRIERDLHDGAQQRLLAVAIDLRLARSWQNARATRSVRNDSAELNRSRSQPSTSCVPLGLGVHPAILGQSGLAVALSSLAEDSRSLSTIDIDRSLRLPEVVETVVYQTLADLVAGARPAGATEVAISVHRADSEVVVQIDCDAPVLEVTDRVTDRVGRLRRRVDWCRDIETHLVRVVMLCVIVAEDLPLTRQGLSACDAGVDVVAQTLDAGDIVQLVARERPGRGHLDIRMPPTHTDEGSSPPRRIRDGLPGLGVLVLSHYVESAWALRPM